MADFEVYVPRVRNDRGVIGVSARDFLASDIRGIQRALKEINPELRTQFMREAKSVGKDAASIVKPALPTAAPLSGMNYRGGRYGWDNQKTGKGVKVKANQVTVAFRTSQGKDAKKMGLQTTSLVSVKAMAPMTSIVDIAGRSNSWTGKGFKGSGMSRVYRDRYGNLRQHRLNGQGEAMISRLGGRGSRFAWPAFQGHQKVLSDRVFAVVEKYAAIANRKFK